MVKRWVRGGFYERRVLKFFEHHDIGTLKEIQRWVAKCPGKNRTNGRQHRQSPHYIAIRNILLTNGFTKVDRVRINGVPATLWGRPTE